jgi:hypothetical protein
VERGRRKVRNATLPHSERPGVGEGSGTPIPPVFLPRSVEVLENKRVEFWLRAKKGKRVWKSLK